MTQGFSPKDLRFGDEGRNKLLSGITKLSNAVKSTLGPQGNTVLIESQEHTHGITVTKDGVTVAKSISLIDPIENLAVRMMKEAADKTATSAGDGTTTAIVLTEAIVKKGTELIDDTANRTDILKEINDITKDVIEGLKSDSENLTQRKMKDVAIISANNDKELGSTIAAVYKDVGKDGVVTVEKSQTSQTYYETTKGIKVDRGWSSPLFINDQKKDECILEDVHIMVSDAEISNILQIENVLKPIIQKNQKLLIIAPTSVSVINTLAANVVKNNLKICNIAPPNFGYKQHELMQDIAFTVGAKYFSEKTGDDLSIINAEDLGHAAKVIVGRGSTVILKDQDSGDQDAIDGRVAELKAAHEMSKTKTEKDFIMSRIASLTGGIGVIYVGGNTDLEQKELYDRVDDAVCAVRSALEEGILPGGGMALYGMALDVCEPCSHTDEEKIADKIMKYALQEPARQILRNAGKNFDEIYPDIPEYGEGYDLKAGEYGNLIKMGVIDPVKVTRTALQNAVSVATTILSTNAIVTMARSYESK
jgi:chaperonin GroEL